MLNFLPETYGVSQSFHYEEKIFTNIWNVMENTDMATGNHQTTGPRNLDSFTYFKEMIAFSILFNGLETLKPLVTKLQKQSCNIYQAWQMID